MQKLLPPILFVMLRVLISILDILFISVTLLASPYNLALGMPLVVLGLGISIYYNRYFHQHDINTMTFDEPSKLLTNGMFKYSRNPMYRGLLLAIFGFASIKNGSIISLAIVLAFFVITDRWHIAFEEKMMQEKFGDEYTNYCKKVRRWI